MRAEDLSGVRTVNGTLRSDCNAGSTYSNQKGYLGDLDMWLNGGGIANLISIPQLERDGYTVTYTTNKSWVVYTPDGKPITFGRDKGGQPTDLPPST